MLIGSITFLSVLTAVLCAVFGGVGVWAAVGIFAGAFLGLALLAFLFLWAVTAGIRQDVPQEKDSKFYRFLLRLYIPAIRAILRMKVELQGEEQLPKDGRFLMVCNHLEILDPVMLLGAFPDAQLAFISKKENADMFIIGNLMHKIMCQLINRENDREALKTILKCIQLLKNNQVSVCVFPEGYTSLDGKLRHFRSGVFKIATKAQVPIVVCTLKNTQKVFHNALHLQKTRVPLHVVGVIQPENFAGKTAVDISNQVYEMMISDLGEDFRPEESQE